MFTSQYTTVWMHSLSNPLLVTYAIGTNISCIGSINSSTLFERKILIIFLPTNFVLFDSLPPSQQFFSHVKIGLHGLNQY